MPVYRLPPQRNPLARFIAVPVFIAVVVVALVLGTVALMIVLALAVLLSLRYAWLRRRAARENPPPGSGDYLEGEYTVKKEEPRRRD